MKNTVLLPFSSKNGAPATALLLLTACAVAHCPTASAVGFRLPNQDPEAIARGNAFAATADNPSAIYYNPAGITQLDGQNVSAGAYFISTGVDIENKDGGTSSTKRDFQAVPQIYYVFSPTNLPVSFGLGVYVPYGLSIDYGNTSPVRGIAQNGSLLYSTLNPVVAWKVTPELSLAIGPTINYSKLDYNEQITPLIGNSQFHFVGDDTEFGFNAGARYQPFDMLSFGVNYHYLTTMDYTGHASSTVAPALLGFPAGSPSSTAASASFRFPQYLVGGISFRPTTNWNIEVDIDWTDWDNVNTATLKNTPFGDIPFPFNYRSSFMYELGVTRALPHNFFVSAGYIFSENSSPSANYNPVVPDSDLSLGNVGVSYRGEHWGFALSYTLAYNSGHYVDGSSYESAITPGKAADGTYRVLNHAINASVRYKF